MYTVLRKAKFVFMIFLYIIKDCIQESYSPIVLSIIREGQIYQDGQGEAEQREEFEVFCT